MFSREREREKPNLIAEIMGVSRRSRWSLLLLLSGAPAEARMTSVVRSPRYTASESAVVPLTGTPRSRPHSARRRTPLTSLVTMACTWKECPLIIGVRLVLIILCWKLVFLSLYLSKLYLF